MLIPPHKLTEMARARPASQGNPLVHLAIGMLIAMVLAAGLIAWASL